MDILILLEEMEFKIYDVFVVAVAIRTKKIPFYGLWSPSFFLNGVANSPSLYSGHQFSLETECLSLTLDQICVELYVVWLF